LKARLARLGSWLSERAAERNAIAEYRSAWRLLQRMQRSKPPASQQASGFDAQSAEHRRR
jgi:hypothetical protein